MARHLSSRKKKIWLGIIASLMIIVLAWWAWGQFAPRPLGDKLEYLGKEDYGNIFGFDYRPTSIYYYGTDMTIDQITEYFSKATRPDKSEGTETWRKLFSLEASDGETIYFYFYNREDFLKENPDIHFSTERNYILSIPGSKYNAAKDSL